MIDQTFTAKNIKANFRHQMYYKDMVLVHETPWLFKPDIATITRDHKVNEYEIKVALSDLRRELDAIDYATQDHQQGIWYDPSIAWLVTDSLEEREARRAMGRETYRGIRRDSNKYLKHRYYLFGQIPKHHRGGRPNRFYFILPSELYEAEKARLDRLPYGVMSAKAFWSLKPCKPLHKEEVDKHVLWQVALNLTKNRKDDDDV